MADRDKKGKFLPGHSGAKPKGAQQFTLLKRELKSRESEVVNAAIKQALSGDNNQALLFLLRKMYGNEPFSDFKLAGASALDVSNNLLMAIGTIDPSILKSASELLQGHLKIVESVDFEARLKELEDAK